MVIFDLLLLHPLPLLVGLGGSAPALACTHEGVEVGDPGLFSFWRPPSLSCLRRLEEPQSLCAEIVQRRGDELVQALIVGLGHVALVTDPRQLPGGFLGLA